MFPGVGNVGQPRDRQHSKGNKSRMILDSEMIRFLVDKSFQRMMLEHFLPNETIYPLDAREWVKPIEVNDCFVETDYCDDRS